MEEAGNEVVAILYLAKWTSELATAHSLSLLGMATCGVQDARGKVASLDGVCTC